MRLCECFLLPRTTTRTGKVLQCSYPLSRSASNDSLLCRGLDCEPMGPRSHGSGAPGAVATPCMGKVRSMFMLGLRSLLGIGCI